MRKSPGLFFGVRWEAQRNTALLSSGRTACHRRPEGLSSAALPVRRIIERTKRLIGRHQDSDHANEKRKDGDVFEKKNARKTMTAPIIKTATESDEARVIDVMVLAFSMDPGARWTWPEPRQYLAHFREFVKALGGGAFSHKSAYYLEGYGGASLWLPPNVRPDEEAVMALFRRTASEKIQGDLAKVFEKMGSYHPSEPHWYLPLIGVDPSLQGNGLGAALLKHGLIACDRDNKPAYLEKYRKYRKYKV